MTMTTEFGPPPYMWTNVHDNSPIESQWDIRDKVKNKLPN